MRVWIVNPFDNLPAEGNRPQRYWLMARAFARAGHEVTLWTADFSHARKAKREFAGPVETEGFRVRLVETPGYRRNVSLGRVWSHRKFGKNWAAAAGKEREAADAVVASVPPLGSAEEAMGYCRGAGAFFAADIMDAWPETFERVVPRWMLWGLRRKAGRIYCGAGAVTAVARRYLELARGYGARGAGAVFHHGIELAGSGSEGREESEKRLGEGRVKLVYVGNMGMSYDLETVVGAVKAEGKWELDLAGAGPKEGRLKELAGGCGRIRFHGYAGDGKVRELLAGADIGVAPMFPESQVGVPYKLADYAAAGLRVVESLGGETRELVERYGAGTSYLAGNMVSFADAVRECTRAKIDRAGFRAAFDAEGIYGRYVDFIIKEAEKK